MVMNLHTEQGQKIQTKLIGDGKKNCGVSQMLNIQTPPAEFNCLLQAAFFLQLGLAKTCGGHEKLTFLYSNSTQWYKPILRFSMYHQVAKILLY
jgi:hypothetical protein